MMLKEGYWCCKIKKLTSEENDSGRFFKDLFDKIKDIDESWAKNTADVYFKNLEKDLEITGEELLSLSDIFGTKKFTITVTPTTATSKTIIFFTDVQFPQI
ncbi:MAG: hypothetical protein PHX25_02040 [Candidatus Pacebacteria bacterium]|nr:hypothetical protein [Candidatus Paceibacterota bacterium]